MLPLEQVTGALISLIIGTLLGSELTRFLYRPRVFIRYEDVSPLKTPDGVHWTILVANFGRTVASDCKGIITIDGLTKEDLLNVADADPNEILPTYKSESTDLEFPRPQYLAPDFFRSIRNENLAWAGVGNPAKISINPGTTENLDVFKVQNAHTGSYVLVPSGLGWRKLRARIKSINLIGRIMVCPANEFPTVINFSLSFDESGKSTFVVRRPSLLERIKRVIFRRRYYYG